MKPCPVCGGAGKVEVPEATVGFSKMRIATYATCGECQGTGWARPVSRIKPPFITAPRVCAELWEGSGWIITVDGRATGCTVREDEARSIVRWLEEALPELTRRLTTDGSLAKAAP